MTSMRCNCQSFRHRTAFPFSLHFPRALVHPVTSIYVGLSCAPLCSRQMRRSLRSSSWSACAPGGRSRVSQHRWSRARHAQNAHCELHPERTCSLKYTHPNNTSRLQFTALYCALKKLTKQGPTSIFMIHAQAGTRVEQVHIRFKTNTTASSSFRSLSP